MSTVQDASPANTGAAEIQPAGSEPTPHHFTAEAFFRMIDAGVFGDDDRVFLRDGRIYEKMAKTQAHAVAGNLAYLTLARLLPAGWFPGGENPVTIGTSTVPLPDLVVLRGNPRDYLRRRPEPGDVGLIVEFSLSSLKFDTTTKLGDYAGANIPVYWVVNLAANVILVFETPIPAERRYEVARTYAVGQSIPFRLDEVPIAEIPAADLLPASA